MESSTTKRIATLVYHRGSGELRYLVVPAGVLSDGYSSAPYELAMPAKFMNELDRTMAALAFMEAGLRAQDEGYAAVVINAFGDYGVQQLRAVASIPVVGAGQAAIDAALGLGRHFGLLTIWPPQLRPIYERLINENGVSERCSGVRFVTSDAELAEHAARGGFGLTLQSEPDTLLDRIERQAHHMVVAGADVIVPRLHGAHRRRARAQSRCSRHQPVDCRTSPGGDARGARQRDPPAPPWPTFSAGAWRRWWQAAASTT